MRRSPTANARRSRRTQRPRALRPNRYAPWRALSLLLVHVLMVIHFLHWKITGKTIAPFEFNEVMHTLELGIITAGFLLMAGALIATALVGRFFCSWGCHILALQDGAAWLLRKLGIRPRPIRSRLLLWVPLLAALYMFVWPQIARMVEGRTAASLRVATDADGWASFATENFWRNLPGPGITITTFFICGFLIVYVLGTRSFCSYGCPYGAVFGLADRLAPGRIRVGPDCTQCATCTAVCTSHVRVHEEVERYGMVVNPACMKDMDCVSACPQQTLRFGFGRPSILRRAIGTKEVQKQFDFSLREECFAALVFVGVLLTYRGLYDLIPFLLSIAIATILAYAAIVTVRLATSPSVSFARWPLRRSGRLTPWGAAFLAVGPPIAALTIHSSVVRYSEFQGNRLSHAALAAGGADDALSARAIAHLGRAQSWGLVYHDPTERRLGDLFAARKQWPEAEASRRRSLARFPHDPSLLGLWGDALSQQGRYSDASVAYARAVEADAARPESYFGLAVVDYHLGQQQRALEILRKALALRPDYAEAHYQIGTILVELGQPADGAKHLRECVRLRPDYGDGHYNLAVALATMGELDAAQHEIDRALAIQPHDDQTRRFSEFLQAHSTGG